MKLFLAVFTLTWISVVFAIKKKSGKVIDETTGWTRNVGGVIIKETAVITRKYGGLLLRSIDENLARVNMSRSSIMFDLKNKCAAVYLYPRHKQDQSQSGLCFVISVHGDYTNTADRLIARNLGHVAVTGSPIHFRAASAAMNMLQRRAFRRRSPLVDGFCYYSPLIDATMTTVNKVGDTRIVVQGIDRPILIHVDKATPFDVSSFL